MSSTQLGWIGLGNMGRGMCKNLVEKGSLSSPLLLYNRTTSKASALATKLGGPSKAIATTSLSDLVSKSDIIFICLGDDKAVTQTIDSILSAASSGDLDLKSKLFVDCSTIHPDTTAAINEKLTSNDGGGASFVACPVFGAPAMADSGQLVCVLAGPSSSTNRVTPYLDNVIGRATIDYTDQPVQRATLLKLIGNTFILSMVTTLSEGHVLAEKSGLGVEQLHKFVETMFPGPYTAYSNRLRSGDYFKREEPLFAVDLARKDAGHVMRIAEGSHGTGEQGEGGGKKEGVRMRGVELADEYLRGVKEHMGARGDIAGIYGAKRVEAGLKFENE